MKWLDALKIYNKDHNGAWCIPKRGTPEYKTVVDIMNGKHMRRQETIQGSGRRGGGPPKGSKNKK